MIRLSKKHKTYFRKTALHLSVILLCCLWVFGINQTSARYLNSIVVDVDHVEGEKDLITVNDIKHIVTKELPNDVMSQRLTRIDLNAIETLLLADTRIFDVQVFIDAHQQLSIEVVQRRPVMRVMNQQGDQFYVDQAGEYVRKVNSRASRVVVITGYVESFDSAKEIEKLPKLNTAFKITNEIGKDTVIKALIESIHFEKNGRIILTPKIGNEKIIIDHIDELSEKLSDLKDFYRQLARTNDWDKYDEIDISYKDQVVVRNYKKP